MKAGLIFLVSLLVVVGLFSGLAFAGGCSLSGGPAAADKPAAKEAVNTTCPVMGGEIAKDTPYTAEYKGKKVGFCCAGCVPAFKKNPDKYMKEIQE